ncbi:hypothetical protein UFOVP695_23 [uncultured Caudovirales phage]|uniref:Uncharacterized protein n=1 Tax=uncultured Caudovirales phage TaxID=2100421 RepID=A0A6J5NMD5_9CAUD|nr:hypothetical protein UFOVP695_23 [uncultured Caudovirales phage]
MDILIISIIIISIIGLLLIITPEKKYIDEQEEKIIDKIDVEIDKKYESIIIDSTNRLILSINDQINKLKKDRDDFDFSVKLNELGMYNASINIESKKSGKIVKEYIPIGFLANGKLSFTTYGLWDCSICDCIVDENPPYICDAKKSYFKSYDELSFHIISKIFDRINKQINEDLEYEEVQKRLKKILNGRTYEEYKIDFLKKNIDGKQNHFEKEIVDNLVHKVNYYKNKTKL